MIVSLCVADFEAGNLDASLPSPKWDTGKRCWILPPRVGSWLHITLVGPFLGAWKSLELKDKTMASFYGTRKWELDLGSNVDFGSHKESVARHFAQECKSAPAKTKNLCDYYYWTIHVSVRHRRMQETKKMIRGLFWHDWIDHSTLFYLQEEGADRITNVSTHLEKFT